MLFPKKQHVYSNPKHLLILFFLKLVQLPKMPANNYPGYCPKMACTRLEGDLHNFCPLWEQNEKRLGYRILLRRHLYSIDLPYSCGSSID